MRKKHALIIASLIFSLLLPAPMLADYSDKRQEAETLYANGDYSAAYKKYRSLAREGDRFAQYRLSYMYLMGEGKKENVIESVAWSVLAAQDKQEELVAYMRTVAGMVPENERKKANKKISYYMRRWGEEVEGSSSRGDEECTGSRLCNHSTSSGNVGVPSNLWRLSSSDGDEGDLKNRAIDLNEQILKAEQDISAGDNEAS